jgi:hypothetical protein
VSVDFVNEKKAVLRHRPFALFWAARTLSTSAYQIQAVAAGWSLYLLTGSALDLGFLGLAEFAPALPLAFVAGHFAGRHEPGVHLDSVSCPSILPMLAAAPRRAFHFPGSGHLSGEPSCLALA